MPVEETIIHVPISPLPQPCTEPIRIFRRRGPYL